MSQIITGLRKITSADEADPINNFNFIPFGVKVENVILSDGSTLDLKLSEYLTVESLSSSSIMNNVYRTLIQAGEPAEDTTNTFLLDITDSNNPILKYKNATVDEESGNIIYNWVEVGGSAATNDEIDTIFNEIWS